MSLALQGRRIVLGVGGGIAAYKAVTLARELIRRGAELRVVMTPSATRFVGPATFGGVTGQAAVSDLWDPSYSGEVHVELGAFADLIVVAPATANLMSRCAAGMADDALLATLSCSSGPVLMAPAMHFRMWAKPAVQRNVTRLTADGVHMVGPVEGALASGETGMGRMAEPEAIAEAAQLLLVGAGDLTGRRVLISAGPTLEDIDPVRFISNRSSGRMGFAVAAAARDRGARVTLVAGPTSVPEPTGVTLLRVRSAQEMRQAVQAQAQTTDVVVMTAAVADYRPAQAAEQKIKKDGERMSIELVKNPDILAELGASRGDGGPVLVGFAMETRDVSAHARSKLERKKVDLIVGNDSAVGFGGDDNTAVLVDANGDEQLPSMSKRALADRILDRVLSLLQA